MSDADIQPQRVVVGFWRRFFADLLDSVVPALFGYAIGYAFINTFSSMGLHAVWVGLVCSFVYNGVLHTRLGEGQTLGKRLLGVQVFRIRGHHTQLPMPTPPQPPDPVSIAAHRVSHSRLN